MNRSFIKLYFNGKAPFLVATVNAVLAARRCIRYSIYLLNFFRRMLPADPMHLFLNTHPSFDDAAADQDIHAAVHGTTLTGFGFTFTKC